MATGGDTFVSNMLNHCGLKNVFEKKSRYPLIPHSKLSSVNCQLLLLSSEPYPFKQEDADELRFFFPGAKIILVDGER